VARLGTRDAHAARTVLLETQRRWAAPRRHRPGAQLVRRVADPPRHREALPVPTKRPDDVPRRIPVSGQGYRERPGLPPWLDSEVCALTSVELFGFDEVVVSDRDVDDLLGVHVEVTEGDAVGPVRVLEPPLEERGDRKSLR